MSQNYLAKFKEESLRAIENFKKEITSLRTGRATPSIVENVLVESYGQKMPIMQLASINVPDPKTIIIQPWDKNNLKEIEKAIVQADLGLAPSVSESFIRLTIPSPTEESRREVIKNLHKKLEDARVALRKTRENIREEILAEEKNGEIPEDEKFKLLESLDEETKKRNDEAKMISDKKESEIMTI